MMVIIDSWIIPSSLTIAAVLAVRFALRGKISLRLQYALWAVVLVRLLLPFQIFISPLSADAVVEELNISGAMQQAYISANEEQYQRQYDATYHESVRRYESRNQQVDPVVVEREAAEYAQLSLALDLRLHLVNLWLTGMTVMTTVIAACNLHLALRLKRARRTLDIPDSLLPVYVTGVVPTPCVFGLFRPVIYLTPAAAEDETVLRHALTHELTHYRHLDHVWSVLRSLCLVLHWYNPLAWIAAKVSRADAELACDEGALRVLGEGQRGDYGRTLIGLTCGARLGSLFVTATTMTGSAGSIRERIRLLMKRPRTTVLTLTALILLVTIIVGCTFSTAPETEQPTITPTPPAETTAPSETAPPGVDNDMSYTGQELPIPEEPAASDLLNAGGLLTYPGIQWFMTEGEVCAALGITARDHLEYRKTFDKEMTAAYFVVSRTDAFGVPMVLDFTFRSYWEDVEPVLTEVYGSFIHPGDFETVRNLYAQALGETDVQITPGLEERWDSDILLGDLVGREGYEILDRCPPDSLNTPAAHVQWLDGDSPQILWFTELPKPDDRIAEVTGLFGLYADPAYRAALLDYYECPADTLESFTMEELFVPEITEVVLSDSGAALVYYRRPGDNRLCAATVYHSEEEGWHVFANRAVVSMEAYADQNPRSMTEEELIRFRSNFNTLNTNGEVNPAACFLVDYYREIWEMDGRAFLAYFPTEQEGTKEDFELLKAKYPGFFGDWTYETMPIPIHRYSAKEVERVVSRYGNIHWQELDDNVHYLEETGCYYNYTSDFGLGGFRARGGFVYDGGAVVYSDFSALFFTETAGSYTIQAHLPAIVAEG